MVDSLVQLVTFFLNANDSDEKINTQNLNELLDSSIRGVTREKVIDTLAVVRGLICFDFCPLLLFSPFLFLSFPQNMVHPCDHLVYLLHLGLSKKEQVVFFEHLPMQCLVQLSLSLPKKSRSKLVQRQRIDFNLTRASRFNQVQVRFDEGLQHKAKNYAYIAICRYSKLLRT